MTIDEAIAKMNKELTTNSRNNAVSLKWYTIHNQLLINGGINPKSLECFSEMFKIDEFGGLKESYYLSDFSRIFVGTADGTIPGENTFFAAEHESCNSLKKLLRIQHKMNKEGDVIFFIPANNTAHEQFKNIVERVVDKTKYYDIYVIDGNNTTNAECEKRALEYSKEARNHDKRMIFIASNMGNRSFSNKYIKNIVFLVDCASDSGIKQKVGRGLSPWDKTNECVVFDFRMNETVPPISVRYIQGEFIDKQLYKEDDLDEQLKKYATPKISFMEYSNIDEDPFELRTVDELKKVIQISDFVYYRLRNIIDANCITVPIKKAPKINIGLENTNTKGDHTTTNKIASRKKSERKIEEVENENKIYEYLNFIVANPKLFRMDFVTENPIQYIAEHIDTKKNFIENELGLTFETVKDIFIQLSKNHSITQFLAGECLDYFSYKDLEKYN